MLPFQVSALTWEVIYQNTRFYPCDGKRWKYQHFSSQNQSASLASISHPSLNPPICRGKASSAESRLTWTTSPFGSTSIKAKSYLRKGYFFPPFSNQKWEHPDHNPLATGAQNLLPESRTCPWVAVWIAGGTGRGGKGRYQTAKDCRASLTSWILIEEIRSHHFNICKLWNILDTKGGKLWERTREISWPR